MTCCPNGDDSMSSGPQTAVGMGISGTDVVQKAEYPNGSGGATPPSHAGIFFRGAFRLPPLSTKFPPRSMRNATNELARTSQGPLSRLGLHIILWG